MKWWKAFAGIAVLSGFGYVVWAQANTGHMPWEKAIAGSSKPAPVSLPKGTPVELILLEGIDAGGTKEGETVDMAVLKDVVIQGKTVIPLGTKAVAEVSKSRGASLLGAVTNRPARLEITLKYIILQGGRKIPISLEKGEFTYIFTQENTAERLNAAKVDNLWNDPGARDALIGIAKSAVDGKGMADGQAQFKNLADRLGMEKSKQLSENPTSGLTLDQVLGAMADNDTGSMQGAQAVLLAQAVGEVSDLVSSVDHKVRGIFKGRTIRANMGTPVMVWTAETEKF
ncbi:MAG: hypothetical protein JNM28_12100 [Armatimonadetes bacterium]|nr:hypothetical protein [Armatimonadota bacterium]